MNTSRGLNRRRFLQLTALAAASTPLCMGVRARAGEASPTNRITLGFIGMGKQNSYLLTEFIHRPQTQVVAVCDVDTTRRERAKQKVEDFYAGKAGGFKGCLAYRDFRDVLARRDIDAVVIATPDHWHAPIAIAAAKAGKDIYCEKPLCQSIREARAMVNAVRANGRVFQTGSMQRSSREFRIAVEVIRNGRLGKIEKVEAAVGGPAIPCDLPAEAEEPGLDWDLWLGPAPVRPYHSALSPRGVHDHFPAWRRYREYGGGGVTDWGAHHFDIVQWALDMDASGPIAISAPPRENAKSGVTFTYANGTVVHHAAGNGITFFGTDGRLSVNRGKFELWISGEKRAESLADLDKVDAELLGSDARRVYKSSNHKVDFLNAMATRKPPITDVEVGARTVSVCHLVNLAYYHGKALKWDPREERFTDGTGDPAWLDVPHREPWKVA